MIENTAFPPPTLMKKGICAHGRVVFASVFYCLQLSRDRGTIQNAWRLQKRHRVHVVKASCVFKVFTGRVSNIPRASRSRLNCTNRKYQYIARPLRQFLFDKIICEHLYELVISVYFSIIRVKQNSIHMSKFIVRSSFSSCRIIHLALLNFRLYL